MSAVFLRDLIRALVLVVFAGTAAAQVVGQPWTGQPAATWTTADIVAYDAAHSPQAPAHREALPRRTIPNAAARAKNPGSPEFPVSQPNPHRPSSSARDAPGPQFAQSVASSFVGITYPQSGVFVPPDPHGDVGPTQILASVNSALVTIDKATGIPDGILNVSSNTFFAPVSAGSGISDQRVIYDRLATRWIIVTINTSLPNRILIAVSNNAFITPSTVWSLYQFQQDLVAPFGNDVGLLCDYPNAGVDANALYIGCDMFDSTNYYGSSIFVVRKSSILTGGPIVVTVFRDLMGLFTNPVTPGPNTPKGVINFDPAATDGYFLGEDNATTGVLDLVRITDPGGTPAMVPFVQITTADYQLPLPVEHKGNNHVLGPGTGLLDGNDNRVMNATLRGGTIWLAHGTAVDATGDGGTGSPDRDAVRWYQLGSLATTPSILQSGTIFDPAATPTPRSYTYGSVNVNAQGHAAFGFTLVGPNDYASAAADGRLLTDASGTTQGVQLTTAGLAAYNNTFDNGQFRAGGVRRWGDFSNTQVDPDDDMTFWTIQEYTEADGTWATRVVKLLAPPPATPSKVSPSTIPAEQDSVLINVTGLSVGGSGFFDPGSGFAKRLDARIAGVTLNNVIYNGPTSVTLDVSTVGAPPGTRDVTIINPDGQSATGPGILVIGAPGGMSETTTAVATSLTPSADGQSVTFTASVAPVPPAAGTPTGSVTFFDGFSTLGTMPLTAGSASFVTSALTVGTHEISATYMGDASFYGSNSPAINQQVLGSASTIVVTNTSDAGIGSLRNALANAQPGDTIVFGASFTTCPKTITLTSGQLVVDKSVSIVGPGARCLTVSGNNVSRVFITTVPGTDVGISRMTIANGRATSGGGVQNNGANLTLTAVAITGNNGLAGVGGGVDNELGGTLLISNSTIAGNITTFRGGGLQSQGGVAVIVNSTITSNTSLRGGGVRNAGGVTTTFVNSTVSNNIATGAGNGGGNLSALNGAIQLQNSIVAEGVGTNPDLDPAGGAYASLDYNQIQSGAIVAAPHDIIGATALLGPLANNGGPTNTRLPPAGSAVINTIPAGGGCNGAGVGTDQRGIARPQNVLCDMGAVETGLTVGAGVTTTTLGTSGNPANGGQTVTFTATVTGASPTGTITFFDGASLLGTAVVSGGVGSLGTSTLAAGSHVISASYSGDALNAASSSTTLTEVILRAATSTVVSPNVNPIAPGASVTFTATVTPPLASAVPAGTVSFYDSGVLLGVATLSGGTGSLLTNALTIPGPHTITAVYSGGGAYNGSTSPVLVETVTGGAATTTTLVSSQNPSVSGDPVTFTASVFVPNGTPTGLVTFKDGAATLGTGALSSGGAAAFETSSLGVGTHSITAVYGGDGAFPGSTSPPLSQLVAATAASLARAFVASFGSDTNTCSLAKPCRSLTSAMAVTSPGGEVIIVDSAGYGPITIAKPLSIIAPPGVYAGISVASGTGIVVAAGTGKVTLRGLTLNGLGGTTGIDFQSGDALYVEGTVVSGFVGAGLNAALSAPAQLFVRDAIFRGNGTGASLSTTAGVVMPLLATIERSQFEGNATGIALIGFSANASIRASLVTGSTTGLAIQPAIGGAASSVDLRNTTVARSTGAGVLVGGNGTTAATLSVTGSQLTDNGIGLDAQAGGTAYATDTTIVRNGIGVRHVAGTIMSFGDNRLTSNVTNGAFSATVPKQ